MVRHLSLVLLFYFLALLESSFFPHFWWSIPIANFDFGLNLILIFVVLINVFSHHPWLGILSAFWAGFFLDVFSERFFGFWILIFLILAIFLKFILRKYLQPVIHLKR